MRRTGAAIAAVACLAVTWVGDAAGAGVGVPKLAFDTGVSTSSVWVAAANGSGPTRLGAGQQPLVSPDGTLVAAGLDNDHGPALAIYATSGGSHPLFNVAKGYVVPLAWSADSRYLAVQINSNTVSGRGAGLAVVDTTTWTERTIATGQIFGASFDPANPAMLVYGRAANLKLSSIPDLYEAYLANGSVTRLTTNGSNLNPVWEARGIVYDHEQMRGANSYPEYQLWLRSGSHARQLTHVHVSSLTSGLVPIAADADGDRLIASFVGEDTDYAVAVQLSPLKVRDVSVGKQYVTAGGISSDGQSLLLNVGSFEEPPSHGTVDSQPFGGGRARVLAKRAGDASWNR